MLFILDDNLIENLQNPNLHLVTQNSIHRILDSWIRGDHFVFASYILLSNLLNGELVHDIDIPALKRLQNKYPFLENLKDFQTYIRVIKGIGIWNVIRNDGELQIFTSPDNIETKRITDKTVLLTENIDEAVFYSAIVESINFEKKNRFKVSYFPGHGGGDTTHQVFSTYQIAKERMCFCIIDSDRKHPTDTLGSTASSLISDYTQNLTNDHTAVMAQYFIPDVSEVENLVPPSILYDATAKNPKASIFCQWLEMNCTQENRAFLFIDFKNGISLKKIAKQNNIIWFKYCLLFSNTNISSCNYLRQNSCIETCEGCLELPGMGNNVLPEVNRVMARMSPQKILEASRRRIEIYGTWTDIANKLSQWICSSNPRYI